MVKRGETKKMTRKMQIHITMLWGLLLVIVLVIGCWVATYMSDLRAENKRLEEHNRCYQVLYNGDIIGSDCDRYFKDDDWYVQYRNDVENSK